MKEGGVNMLTIQQILELQKEIPYIDWYAISGGIPVIMAFYFGKWFEKSTKRNTK